MLKYTVLNNPVGVLVLLTTMSVKLFSRKNDIHLESGSWGASFPPGRWGVKERLPWLLGVPVAFPSSGYASWTSKQNMKHGQHTYILHPDHLQSAGSFWWPATLVVVALLQYYTTGLSETSLHCESTLILSQTCTAYNILLIKD